MTVLSRRAFAGLAACACVAPSAVVAQGSGGGGKYVCPPCGCSQDGKVFDKPGVCPDPSCGMTLIEQAETAPFEPARLAVGSGMFLAAGGPGREAKRIRVDYYRPTSFRPTSPILIVLPGAGRNSAEYRDAWIETAIQKGVLVAALGYAEADYDFAAYQMGGVIRNLRFPVPPGSPSVIRLRDEDIQFEPNPDPAQWIFADFDRIFGLLVRASGSTRTGYDLFGHSAGGQVLSRLVLFRPLSKAERIVAANAGQYTLPDLAEPQPFGLKDSGVTDAGLKAAFGCRLTLLLGEKDDGDEAGGIQLRTPRLDRQGKGRLSRGRYVFAAGERQAKALGAPFGWRLQTVPDVGHDYRRMSAAAAKLLYG